jgi:hypothetical protein
MGFAKHSEALCLTTHSRSSSTPVHPEARRVTIKSLWVLNPSWSSLNLLDG